MEALNTSLQSGVGTRLSTGSLTQAHLVQQSVQKKEDVPKTAAAPGAMRGQIDTSEDSDAPFTLVAQHSG